MKHFFSTIIFCLSVFALNAQTQNQPPKDFKIAYFDMDSLLNIMPEFKAVSDSVQKHYAELETKMYALNVELQTKTEEFDKMHGEGDTKKIEKEIADLQQRITDFQAAAMEEYTAYKEYLMEPVFLKIAAAAKKIAKEKGYAYVLDGSKSAPAVIFANESYDIFDEMCKELHIPVSKR